MLTFTILQGGGMKITGTAGDLRALAEHLKIVASHGVAQPAYVTDEQLTTITIIRTTDD